MKSSYIKVRVFSLIKEMIVYEKDFSITHVFERFIRLLLAEIVEQRVFSNEGKFSVRIIPKFDAHPRYNCGIKDEREKRPYPIDKKRDWWKIYRDD